jgi:hypothetical protein
MNRSGGQYASDYHYLALHASAGTSTKDTGNRATQKFMSKSDVGSSRASTRYRETRKLSCHSSAVNKQMICSRRQRLLSAHLLVWQADNGLRSLLRRRLKVSLESTYIPTATFTNPTNPRENQSPRRRYGTVSNTQQPHHSSSVYKHVRRHEHRSSNRRPHARAAPAVHRLAHCHPSHFDGHWILWFPIPQIQKERSDGY